VETDTAFEHRRVNEMGFNTSRDELGSHRLWQVLLPMEAHSIGGLGKNLIHNDTLF
jgi:hypothetical protein